MKRLFKAWKGLFDAGHFTNVVKVEEHTRRESEERTARTRTGKGNLVL